VDGVNLIIEEIREQLLESSSSSYVPVGARCGSIKDSSSIVLVRDRNRRFVTSLARSRGLPLLDSLIESSRAS
jgi:hypothetical protein